MSKNKINRRDFLKLTGLIAAGAVIASCTTQQEAPTSTSAQVMAQATDTSTPIATATTTPVATAEPQPTATTAPASTATLADVAPGIPGVARGDILIYNNGTQLFVDQNLGYMTSQQGNACVLEPLYFYTPQDPKTPLTPWLANGKWVYNAEYTAMTVKLRKDVTWSDGTPFTSADVVWTVNFAISQVTANLPPPAYGGQIADNFKNAVAPDDFTVIFNSLGSKPNPRMHRWICSAFDTGLAILPKHIFEKLDPKTIDQQLFIEDTRFTGVVTAPYICVYMTPEKAIFDRREDWWGAKSGFHDLPDIKRIFALTSSSDQTLLSESYSKNEFDTSFAPLPSNMKSIINQNPELTTWTGRKPPLGNVDHWPNLLWLNNEDPLFNDSRVRWAISYALNTQKLIDNVWGGLGIASRIPFSQFGIFQPYIDALTPLFDKYPVGVQDLDKSAALMKEAGWTLNADKIWEKGGKIFQPNFGGFNAIYADIGPAFCEQLTQAGFKTDYKEPPDLWSGGLSKGVYNMCIFGFDCDLDVYDAIEYFGKNHYAPNGSPLPLDAWNSRFNNTDYNTIVDQMTAINPDDDPEAYTNLILKAMDIWYRELPAIPVWQWMHYVPMNQHYWTNWPSQDNPYGVPAQWLRNGGFPTPVHLKKVAS